MKLITQSQEMEILQKQKKLNEEDQLALAKMGH
jgi:hypothetical protein